jgi:hypothetical protein
MRFLQHHALPLQVGADLSGDAGFSYIHRSDSYREIPTKARSALAGYDRKAVERTRAVYQQRHWHQRDSLASREHHYHDDPLQDSQRFDHRDGAQNRTGTG